MFVIISLIISAFVILRTVYVKIQDKEYFEAMTLGICGAAIIINGIFMYMFTNRYHVSVLGEGLLGLSKLTIVPLAYLYFCRRLGHPSSNAVLFLVWFLAFQGAAPGMVAVPDLDTSGLAGLPLKSHRMFIVSGGAIRFNIHLADLCIATQAIITAFAVVPMIVLMRRYHLRFTAKMTTLLSWWGLCMVFIAYSSTFSVRELATPFGQWFYFGSLFFFTCAGYLMFSFGLDKNPVRMKRLSRQEAITEREEQEEENTVTTDSGSDDISVIPSTKLDAFIEQSSETAMKVRKIVIEDKAYLDPAYNTECAIRDIGTNRTYFSRMMQVEFGCKFTDLLTDLRLEYAKKLLDTTEKMISEIAEESGFNGASYFSRKFSAKYGIAPTDYRKDSSL